VDGAIGTIDNQQFDLDRVDRVERLDIDVRIIATTPY
jgi:hypothetical protein